MRIFLRVTLLVVVLLVIAAVTLYQVYLKVGDYEHAGAMASPPSTAVAPDAEWIDLFDGQSLDGWTPKFVGYAAGENHLDTFRVEDGAITVSYDNYPAWNGEFGHLFYEAPFDHYVLQLEYRFIGEQIAEGAAMAWAWRNSGVMVHSEPPDSMTLLQDFPVSLEAQLLGARDGERRTTGNLCTPGTHVVIHDELHTQHCINSMIPGTVGDGWVQLELEVRGNELIRHFIDGALAVEYHHPRLDTWGGDGRRLHKTGADTDIGAGYIALQSESHPVQFRNIRLLPLQ